MIRFTKTGAAVAVGALLSLAPSAQADTVTDNFNRPDGTDMGSNWTEQTGDWRLEGGMARGGDRSLMTFNNATSSAPTLGVDVYATGSTAYASLVSLYADLSHSLFVKVQDNNSDGSFDKYFFYYGNNGSGGGFGDGNLSTTFTEGRIGTVVAGNTVTLQIDTNFDGSVD